MEGQVIAEISIIPVGTATPSLSSYIAACLDPLKGAEGIRYQLTAMGTIIQGPLERILELASQMHRAPFARGAQRVVTTVSIDERRDKPQTMESKVEAVLGRGPW